MTIKIVTDSTADLPPSLAKDLDITVVPCTLHFGQETFRDGIDMDADTFYKRLVTKSQLPTTSQPTPGDFVNVYKGLTEAGHQVLSIHLSADLSGTMNSARQAKEQLGDASVDIVDSRQVSLSLGLIVLAAARAVKSGATLPDTTEIVRKTMGQVQLFALLDTLEYLRRGGRIGKVRGFVGSLLHVRPMITVRDGIVQSVTSVRSRAAGIQYLVTLAEEAAPLQQLAIMHSTAALEAEALTERLRPLVSDGNVVQARIGPVIGTHVGPGAIGLAFQSEKAGVSS